MDTNGIRSLCKKLPAVTEDIKWGHDLVFSVGSKMFCVVGMDEFPVSAAFKVQDEEFEEISSRPGFKPAPYVARYKWVLVDDISRLTKKQGGEFIRQSYQLVKDKLPKKIKKELKLD